MTAGNLVLYGETRPDAAAFEIAFGRMSCQLQGGALHDIRVADCQILRSVQFIVRDRYWRTIAPDVEAAERPGDAEASRFEWSVRFVGPECDLKVAHRLVMTSDTITLSASATALASLPASASPMGAALWPPRP